MPTGNIHTTGTVPGTGVSVADATEFFQLRGDTAGAWAEILEVRVCQTTDTALAMNALVFAVGDTGSGGTGTTEYNQHSDVPTGMFVGAAGTVVDVTNITWLQVMGWNILQEFVWLPTPKTQIYVPSGGDFGIRLANSDTLTCEVNITWEEFGI